MFSTMLIAAAVAVTGATVPASGGSQAPERPRNESLSPPSLPVSSGMPAQIEARQDDRQVRLLRRALEAKLQAEEPLFIVPRQTPSPAPKIVCGMKMIEVDPKIDEKILLPPSASDVDPKIRITLPAACRE